ncbi:hypothetical protein BsWGS_12620 [Bradybaena similaris]
MTRFKAPIGRVPREAESFVFVTRSNPRTGQTRTVPELVYPIEANRSALPKHALLEDDWRAYRAVLHNYESLVYSQMDPIARMLDYFRSNELVSRIYKNETRDVQISRPPATFVPALSLYQNSVDAPLGYMYRRFKQGTQTSDSHGQPASGKQQLQVPVIMFEGPFTDTVQVSQGRRVREQWDREMQYYDADVIVTSSKRPRMYIYNEPDSIPVSCARTDFSLPLSQRVTNRTLFSGHTAAGADTQAQPQPTAPGVPPRL